ARQWPERRADHVAARPFSRWAARGALYRELERRLRTVGLCRLTHDMAIPRQCMPRPAIYALTWNFLDDIVQVLDTDRTHHEIRPNGSSPRRDRWHGRDHC